MDDAKLQKKRISEMKGYSFEGRGGGWVIRTLFCDVKSLRTVRIVIAASEEFAQDGVISTWQTREYVRSSGDTRGVGRAHGFLTPLGLICHPAR